MNKALKEAKKIFGKTNIKSIEPFGSSYINKCKIVVFVPLKNADELAFAMASAGAGVIGNYTVCSFRIKGVGTFIGSKDSKPAIGSNEKYEMIEEIRMEMICDKQCLDEVVAKIYEVHPYEEPAFEIYDVMTRTKAASEETINVQLKKKVSVKNIFMKINRSINILNIPEKIINTKIKYAVIDYSENETPLNINGNNKVLYIKKSKNITNIELK